jgi:hypothetical protein
MAFSLQYGAHSSSDQGAAVINDIDVTFGHARVVARNPNLNGIFRGGPRNFCMLVDVSKDQRQET